jgi:hypothetical protein
MPEQQFHVGSFLKLLGFALAFGIVALFLHIQFGVSFRAMQVATVVLPLLNFEWVIWFPGVIRGVAFGRGSRGPWNKCDDFVFVAFMPRKPLDALEDADTGGSGWG